MAIKAKVNGTKVVTGLVRLSYANLFEPKGINGSEPKYSVSIIISKKDKETINAVKKAIAQATEDGKAKLGKINPKTLKTPLRDGDDERPDDEAYQDSYFINANSKTKPQVVDKSVMPILDASEVYSGCYGRVSVNFYAFNSNGNKGIACGLANVQKIKDGEPLGSVTRAEDDFDAEDDDDEGFLD